MARPRKPGEFGPITARDRAEMRRMNADADWFYSLPSEELKKLAGKFVAVKGKQIVAASRSMAGLSRKLTTEGIQYVFVSLVEEPMTVVY